ncbi:MAG: hypothetical protein LC642_06620, partial [Verrucomicrobiaceae bacterium]|nr:hypothetical protein [Verrucomicrobiaceae bacterium]
MAGNNDRSRREDKSAKRNGKRFVRKKRRSGRMMPKRRFRKFFSDSRLANAGTLEAAVVFDADLAAAQQIGHCRDRFAGVFGAGAHRKDEIAQGECARLEDLCVIFHRGCAPFLSNMDATQSGSWPSIDDIMPGPTRYGWPLG